MSEQEGAAPVPPQRAKHKRKAPEPHRSVPEEPRLPLGRLAAEIEYWGDPDAPEEKKKALLHCLTRNTTHAKISERRRSPPTPPPPAAARTPLTD